MRNWLSVSSSLMSATILASLGGALVGALWIRKTFGKPVFHPTKPWN